MPCFGLRGALGGTSTSPSCSSPASRRPAVEASLRKGTSNGSLPTSRRQRTSSWRSGWSPVMNWRSSPKLMLTTPDARSQGNRLPELVRTSWALAAHRHWCLGAVTGKVAPRPALAKPKWSPLRRRVARARSRSPTWSHRPWASRCHRRCLLTPRRRWRLLRRAAHGPCDICGRTSGSA